MGDGEGGEEDAHLIKKLEILNYMVSHEGLLDYRVVWESYGDDMPPPNSGGYGAFRSSGDGYIPIDEITLEDDD